MMTETKPGSIDRPAVDLALLIVRIIVGVIFMFHGAGKVFGWFGGPGLAHMMLPPNMENPQAGGLGPVLGFLVSIGECFGGLGLAIGFLSRFSALANIVIMGGAIAMVHGKNGFSLPHGFEYNFALIGLLAPILIAGPGQFSIGRFLPLPKKRGSDRPVIVLE